MVTTEQVFEVAQQNGRICPRPIEWKNLYDLLPNKVRKNGGWEPALPLILGAWHETPALMKILRLREHIEWAAQHGCLDVVYNFMAELREEDWFHFGE